MGLLSTILNPGSNVNMPALRDWLLGATLITPLEHGAVGNGVADDTAAITAALATGKSVVFPKGYTFKTSGNHSITTSNQRLVIGGKILHDGSRPSLGGGVYGYEGLFLIQDQVTGVRFEGGGILDGAKASFSAGDRGSGIQAYRAISLTVDGISFENFIDDGIKAHNCPNLVTTKATRFYNIHNIGVEMRSYGNDPRTAAPWVGTAYGPSGDISGFFDKIDDGLHGAGNGCGVDFSPGDATAPDITNLRVSGRYQDCLRAIFTENNYPSTVDVKDIIIDSPVILGNYRGAGTVETKDGIGIVNGKNIQIISPIIRNVGNFAPVGGKCAGIHVSGDDVSDIDIINPQIIDDTGATDRTDYGVYIASTTPDSVRILRGKISGMSDGPINKGGAVNLRIEGVEGATDDETWGTIVKYTFKVTDIPASANTSLLWQGEAGHDAAIMATPGRIVATLVRLNASISSGSLGFKTYRGATEETALEVVNGDWGGAVQVIKKRSATSATQIASGSQIKVTAVSSSLSPTTIDAIVEVYVDIGMKQ